MISWLWDTAWWLIDWAWAIARAILRGTWRGAVEYARKHPLAAVLAALAILRMFGTTVQSGTAGVLFSWGRAKKVLEPGFHPLIPIVQAVRHTPVRSVTMDLPRQRVTTGDGLVYDVDTNVVYRVDDPILAAVAIDDVRQGVSTLIPLLVHELLRGQTRQTLVETRQALDQELTARARQALLRWGLHVETVGMSTIAPTRPTVRLTQLPARVAEREGLLRRAKDVAPSIAAALTTAVQAPMSHSRARYRRQHAPAFKDSSAARVSVIVPPGGQLTVNDVDLDMSDTRTFDTPRLEREKAFYYTMRVLYHEHGIPIAETRTVKVKAGKVVTVDFTKPEPESAATS